jgi:hypothetical protein
MGPELSRRGLLEGLGAALFVWWGRPPGVTPAAPVDVYGAGTVTTVV